jgi:stage IV sporulation protein FB
MSGCSVQRWSVSLGRWAGVRVRIHIFFLLFAAFALALAVPAGMQLEGAMVVGIALGSVLLHEAAHVLAALRVGGRADTVVLGPVGGLISPRVPDEPEVQLFTALAGPIAHLAVVVAAAIGLATSGHSSDILPLLSPMAPETLWTEGGASWLMFAKLTLWFNWVLMLLNFLPAYPFDGGPIFRSMLWPALGRRTARIVTGRAGIVIGLLICVAAWLPFEVKPELDSIPWLQLPLSLLGIFLVFSARQDLVSNWSDDLFEEMAGYHAGGDGLDLLEPIDLEEDDDDAVLVEHQQRQTEPRENNRRVQEAYEDARVDDILARLHDSSMGELSNEEIEILRRASERYKQRLHPDDNG